MTTLVLAKPYNVPEDSALCLHFANTLDWRLGGVRQETLPTYVELLQWSQRRGIIDAAEAVWLEAEAQRHPILAGAVHQRAIALREAIARLFACTSRGQTPAVEDLDIVNAELRMTTQQLQLHLEGDATTLACVANAPTLEMMLLPIALSVAELLISPQFDRVRQCADDEGNGCGFFFVDLSRNKSRRWCSMESCGNRAKARRHYHRERSGV